MESHLGSSYESNRLLVIMSWTARKRTTTFLPLPSLTFDERVRHLVKRFFVLFCFVFYTFLMKVALQGTAHPPMCTSYFKQHFQPVVSLFIILPAVLRGWRSKWPSFLTFADISNLMRVKSSRLDD